MGLVPGALGGICNVAVGHPLDLVKVRLQMATNCTTKTTLVSSIDVISTAKVSSQRVSTVGILQTILRTDGVQGLYAGVSAPLIAAIPAFAMSFASYEFAKNVLLRRNETLSPCPRSLSVSQTAAAGAFSGLPLAFVIGPMERIKCLMQIYPKNPKYMTFASAVTHVYSQGGIRSITRGTFLTICRDVPGNAAYFATYEYLKRFFIKNLNYNDSTTPNSTVILTATIFAGGFAGVANWIVAIPIDVVKSRWQTADPGQYSSVRAVVRHLLQTQGPAAFFNGLMPALLRAFPANAACFVGAETAKRWITLLTDRKE
jgi:solute carrier family 25 (mitochondrial carnitine/acylcarnitine transporter), member 20/29